VKAAVLHAAGEPLRLEDVRLAGPGPGEVLVRVQAAGICHSDLHYLTGSTCTGRAGCRLTGCSGPSTGSTTSTRRSRGCRPNLSAGA